jgi:peptidoglycan/LPS O-acetylase OafA/YrhL
LPYETVQTVNTQQPIKRDSGLDATSRNLTYQPGLDGLRAVALLSIFVVHSHIGWAPGGFLAVSTFFTLSGFLIMALLVKERDGRGRIDLVAFWQRRARRLLPASLLAVLLIAIITVFLGDYRQIDLIGGDVVSTLAYVANWRFILQETTYAGEFGGQSPLLHFWSLAIEEQFYLLFPLVMAAAMTWSANWRRSAAIVLVLGIGLSLAMGIIASGSDVTVDRLYFRTDIRAGELLVGALFGLWWMGPGRTLSAALHRLIRIGGAALLFVMVGMIATSDYRERFWYQGGLIAYSLITVAVILAAVESHGLVRKLLSWPPLVYVGVVSYGAYLVHWPLFMWLYTETAVPGAVRLIGGTAVAIALAALSHHLLELPIREKRFAARPMIGFGISTASLAIAVALATSHFADPEATPLETAAKEVRTVPALSAAAPSEAPTIGVFGDSTALLLTLGLAYYDDKDKAIRVGQGWSDLGCTPSAPAYFILSGKEEASNSKCDGWVQKWRAASDAGQLDAAVVQFGPWEVRETRMPGADSFSVIGEDPARDALIAERITEGLNALAKTPLVIIMTSPYIEPGRRNGRPPMEKQPDADPARMDHLNKIIVEVAERYPNVAVVDLAAWVNSSKEDRRLRPDGVHFTREVAEELAPHFATTFAVVVDVFKGGKIPEDTSGMIPVLRYIEPEVSAEPR